jgi:coatomer subunit beta'
LKEQALIVATDLEHRFDLSIQLERLDLAFQIASELDHEHKWKVVGDTALNKWNVSYFGF